MFISGGEKMKYQVVYKSVERLILEVEAESPEEAMKIAANTDGGEFILDGIGSWDFDFIQDEDGNEIDV